MSGQSVQLVKASLVAEIVADHASRVGSQKGQYKLSHAKVGILLTEREELRAMLSEAECPMCEPGVAPVDPGCPWCAKRRDLGAAP